MPFPCFTSEPLNKGAAVLTPITFGRGGYTPELLVVNREVKRSQRQFYREPGAALSPRQHQEMEVRGKKVLGWTLLDTHIQTFTEVHS